MQERLEQWIGVGPINGGVADLYGQFVGFVPDPFRFQLSMNWGGLNPKTDARYIFRYMANPRRCYEVWESDFDEPSSHDPVRADLRRGTVVTKLHSKNGGRPRNAPADALNIWDCAFDRSALSGVMKRFGQFGCAEHVCDALQVIRHRREADFPSLHRSNPRISKRGCRMPETDSAFLVQFEHQKDRCLPVLLRHKIRNCFRENPR